MLAMSHYSAIVRKLYILNLDRRTQSNRLNGLLIFLCSVYSWQAVAATPISPVVVTSQVAVVYTGSTLNRSSNTYDTQATLTNQSGTAIQTPIQLAISNISQPTVTLANPAGVLADGTPFVNIPVSDGTLSPAEVVKGILLKFNNPKRVKFTFSHNVLGVLPAANHPPVANPGGDTSAPVGQAVTLSALDSSDEDGDPLTYRWQLLEKPTSSNAQLDTNSSLQTQFTIDRKGNYRIELIVNDGKVDSQPAYVNVSTENSKPIAKAGDDQTVKVKQTALLDGGNSSDIDGDSLTYAWELLAKPGNSAAGLQNPDTQTPSLTPDLPGSYTLQMKVNDGLLDSLPDQLIVSTENSKPVANAGANQTAQVGDAVTLDGSLSTDVDSDPLSYVWSILNKPGNSNPELKQQDQIQAILTPDLPGDYVAQLIVNDSKLNSDPATSLVTVSVKPVVNHPPQITSSPLTAATVGNLYTYDVDATDSDNDTLTYSLSAYPTGMSINNQTGLISWTPLSDQTGNQAVSVNVTDNKGGADTQSYSIGVNVADSVSVPNLVNISRANAEADIQNAKLNIGTLTFQHNTEADGSVISQSPTAGSSVKIGAAVNLTISLGPDNGLPPNPATVAPKLDPTVATSTFAASEFLYSGSNPIQTGVQPGTIEPKRAAVLRGKVLDRQNNPLPGVTLTILDHPEYGQTKSRADGQFDLAVNGGGYLTVNYQKDGYLPSQRQINVPWQDYALYDDVVLIQLDSQVTTIDLDNTVNMQVARGNPVTDLDGTRQATLLFPVGTRASITLPDGSVQPLSSMHVRATEYTVGANGPEAMPGPLPPSSGYTYAVEYSVDEAIAVGAKNVLFDRPIPAYLDNFLGVPVGARVPVAFYDRGKGAWIPIEDGKVIKILNTDNGVASIDTNGDGTADDGLSIDDAERRQLAQLYGAEKTLWRVTITHFTPCDWNFPITRLWAYGATAPKFEAPKSNLKTKLPDSKIACGSIIECENQTLGESIPITGSSFNLHYNSDRVPGSGSNRIILPITGNNLPSELKGIELEIIVAGRKFSRTFGILPNQNFEFNWDGKDNYGRTLQGFYEAKTRLKYFYDAYYVIGENVSASFGLSGEPNPSTILARYVEPLIQDQTAMIASDVAPDSQLSLWSITPHHFYDPEAKVLFMGDGSKQSASSVSSKVKLVAGTGTSFPENGRLATNVDFTLGINDIAIEPDGSVLIAANTVIYRVDTDGIIKIVAGGNGYGYSGDGGIATLAKLGTVSCVTFAKDGGFFFCEDNRVRRVTGEGILFTVAGTGVSGYSGDEGDAKLAQLNQPKALAVSKDGSLFIADRGNGRIRKVGCDGHINTIVGYLQFANHEREIITFPGANFNRSNSLLNDLAVSDDGTLFIAFGCQVAKIQADGVFNYVAGTGNPSCKFSENLGDGGLARNSSLNYVQSVEVDTKGNIYLLSARDSGIGGQRPVSWVRHITPQGIISTVMGGYGNRAYGGPANAFGIEFSTAMSLSSTGEIFVADGAPGGVVSKVTPLMPGFTAGDISIPSKDGFELYHFDPVGRHLRTLDTLTGNTKFNFNYDSKGRLNKITDRDENQTIIERDALGKPTGVVTPFGQQTELKVESNGFLSEVSDSMGRTHKMSYSADGLLSSFAKPTNLASSFVYDVTGRLVLDKNAADGSQALTRAEINDGFEVARKSSLNRTTIHRVQNLATGDQIRTEIAPDNTQVITVNKSDGTHQTTSADGTLSTIIDGPDPRFGIQVPVAKSVITNLAVKL
jgi:YD repeat-containing protein